MRKYLSEYSNFEDDHYALIFDYKRNTMRYVIFILLSVASLPGVFANIVLADPTDFRVKLQALEVGDTMYLLPGNYTQSLRLENLSGSASEQILIASQPGMAKSVFLGNSCCNTVSITQCEFIHLRDLICDGQNIAGIDAIKAEGSSGNWSHDIEIEGFEIINYGADQQNVGISTKCPSWNWHVHHNVVDFAGTGFYFGNSNGEDPFVNGLIEYNLIKNTIGYNGQIKHQNPNTRDLSLDMPADAKTIIRYNVFSKMLNASSGSSARPNLLVGNFPASGNGSDDYYEIYGNLFYQNPNEGLFQGTGNIGFYNNLLYNNAGGWGLNIQSHVGFAPREIDLFSNTVLIDGSGGISISGVNSAYDQKVVGNAVFSPNPIAGGSAESNVTDAFAAAGSYVRASSSILSSMNLTPSNSSLEIGSIDLLAFAKYENHTIDFDGKGRDGNFAGAYTKNAEPLWPLQLEIRDQIEHLVTNIDGAVLLSLESILIYPNPAQNLFTIDGFIGAYDIEVLNANGSLFQSYTGVSAPINIDINGLPSGTFLVKMENKSNSILSVQKLIKIE